MTTGVSETLERSCPKCRSKNVYRIGRAFWMRWFKGSKRYQCTGCLHVVWVMAGQ